MRRVRTTLLLAVIATVGIFGFAGASSAGQSNVGPSQSAAAAAAPSCRDFWQHSGHTDRVRWYHCHPTNPSDPYVKRVHICGVSGTLHGITVANLNGAWVRNEDTHRHDPGGEGC